jgi:hypothetical protein
VGRACSAAALEATPGAAFDVSAHVRATLAAQQAARRAEAPPPA